ncbi:histidine phosphatase family protein [Glycomyces luteolus]|uniref:Histidine phosphatase family protein n=1 Tax=Glycomyces luteolus TaxID=2670330 RepID=A0A9X3PC98_9ACTN|nr:histidine phosphatase family protein [Glycomyces luteolus]MDA1361441.1 histidine phosphatase family protein [Glycomyces luteolus]
MRTLYVVTHPQATHHVEGRVGGWYDSDLTPGGVEAAGRISDALRAAIPDASQVELYSSDLQRTKQTADVIGKRFGLEPVFDPRLREGSFGEAEGHPQSRWDELFTPPPAEGDRMGHLHIPGSESRGQVAQRIYAAMDEITRSPCEHQIIVTHGYAFTFAVAAWIRMPIEALGYAVFKARSGSITTLHEDDLYRGRLVLRLAATEHLEG